MLLGGGVAVDDAPVEIEADEGLAEGVEDLGDTAAVAVGCRGARVE